MGSGPCKRDEDGDFDEDDHLGDDSPPDGTPVPPRERRRGSPPCASSSMASTLWSLAFMVMMAPGGTPVPPEARGREPPSFFFFLDLLPRWEKGFPSGPWSPWRGRGEIPSEIGFVSLFLCS